MSGWSHRAGFLGSPAPVYFDELRPAAPSALPCVVMVHGGSHTGSCYLMTADGRPGWAYRFVQRGFPVCVPDWPGHGRSGGALLGEITGELVSDALAALVTSLERPVVLLTHSMGAAFGWRVAELCAGQVVHVVAVAPAAPGNLAPEARLLREHAGEFVAETATGTVSVPKGRWSRASVEMIAGKLVGTSRQFPAAAGYPSLVSPTAARLVYERMNVAGSQLRVRDPRSLCSMAVTIVTGSEDRDHPEEVDRALADWWSAQGVRTEYIWLADHGCNGNGHMVMMEANSDLVADLLMERLLAGSADGVS